MNILASLPQLQFHLLGAEYFKMSSPQPSRLISRRVWVVELIVQGRLQVRADDSGWITLDETSSILYAPGTSYCEKVPDPGSLCRSIGLFFEMKEMPKISPWDRLSLPYLHLQDREKLLLPLAENCLHHLGLGAADDVLASASFLHIMALLLNAEKRDAMLTIASEPAGGDMVARAHQYMRARLGKTVGLAEIAGAVGLSVSGFAHGYKQQTGVSPMAMLRHMRVEAVKSYLLRERFTLDQIASETGFADAFHLSRTFKNITGASPRQFRRGEIGAKETRIYRIERTGSK